MSRAARTLALAALALALAAGGLLGGEPFCSEHVCLEGPGAAAPGNRRLLDLFEREYAELDGLPPRLGVRLYADYDAFRKGSLGTGRDAARWRSGRLHLAPLKRLAELGILGSVVRHELTHLWVRSLSAGRAPRWLEEGICVWRSGELGTPPPPGERPELEGPRGRLTYREAGRRVESFSAACGPGAVAALLSELAGSPRAAATAWPWPCPRRDRRP